MSYHKPFIQSTVERPRRGGRQWKRFEPQENMRYHIPAQVLPIIRRTGGTYLGEDETYYYWMEPGATDQLGGMFDNIGNMFKRMVKFTPKSFTPGNIYKGFVNTTLTTASFGAYQLLPKGLKKSVYEIGKVAIPIVAGGALAVVAGPAVMATLMPKLAAAGKLLGGIGGSMFGGKSGASGGGETYGPPAPGVLSEGGGFSKALTIGGELMNLLGKLPQNKQAEVVQQLTPEDIAYMEQYKQVPPHLKGYFDSMAEQTFNPPVPSSGSASLYDAYGQSKPDAPAQASMFGNLDMTTILLFAVPLGFYLLTSKGSRR